LQSESSFITALGRLGDFLGQFPGETAEDNGSPAIAQRSDLNHRHKEAFQAMIESEHIYNPWFTREAVLTALGGISLMLKPQVLSQWLNPYHLTPLPDDKIRTVGLVMAGNIPLVGFHDLMCVLACGHRAQVKASSKDERLIKKVAELLSDIDPEMGSRIHFTDGILSGLDAVIATGSNNSARYFEYYFRHIPHIIRKNRNGVAVLTGGENEDQLYGLGRDIFTYFGMGCRNVTKIYIPPAYDLKILLGVLDRFSHLSQHHKYINNVDYYRTLYLMNQVPLLDNGVLLLKEDPAIASPVGVVFYERYSEIGRVVEPLELHKEEIQCIVSIQESLPGAIAPGKTQEPMPWDYADGIDTLEFLKESVR
jgi:hypothetical protein